jgi:hypothetical protein
LRLLNNTGSTEIQVMTASNLLFLSVDGHNGSKMASLTMCLMTGPCKAGVISIQVEPRPV